MNLLTVFLTTLAAALVGSLVPIVNTEIYLLGASALAPPRFAPALILAAAVGQMAGKSLLYYAGRGALRIPSARLRGMVDRVREKYASDDRAPALGGGVLLLSAGIGLPPFYVVSVACGMFRIRYLQFLGIGLLGMLIRYTFVVLAPQLIRGAGG